MTIQRPIWAVMGIIGVCAAVAQAGVVGSITNAGTSNQSFTVDLSAPSPVRTFSVDVSIDVSGQSLFPPGTFPLSLLSCQLKLVCGASGIVQVNSGTYDTTKWDSGFLLGIPVGVLSPISVGGPSGAGWVGGVPAGDIICPTALIGHVKMVTLNMEVLANATPGIYTLNVTNGPSLFRAGDCKTQSNVGGSPGTSFTLTVGPLPAVPPVITTAVSRKTQGGAGTFDVDMINPLPSQPIAVECRQGGPTQVVVNFDQAIAGVGGLDNSDVALASTGANPGAVSSVAISGGQLTINMSGTSDAARMKVSFPGICSSVNPAAVATGTLCAGVLAGDVTGDGLTNIFDLVSTRNNLNAFANAGNYRSDVNNDGNIDVLDLVTVRNQLNLSIPAACP